MKTKRLFLVNANNPVYVSNVLVLFSDNGQALTYFDMMDGDKASDEDLIRSEDSWTVYDCHRFFDTKQQAEQYLRSLVPGDDEIERVFKYVRCTSDWDSNEETNRLRTILLNDNIGYGVYNSLAILLKRKPDSLTPAQANARLVIELLKTALRGYINVNAETVAVKDVTSVRWGDDKAVIVLSSGREIKTSSREEFEVLEAVFGENISGRAFMNVQ